MREIVKRHRIGHCARPGPAWRRRERLYSATRRRLNLTLLPGDTKMIDADGDLDQSDDEFDRRQTGRTRIAKDGQIFVNSRIGVRSCSVRDVTNSGAGIRTQDISILPLNFDLSFDKFRTIRRCRLIWREGDFIGVAFET
jgi:hypothetical protein